MRCGREAGTGPVLLAVLVALAGACHDDERTRTLVPSAIVEGGPVDFGEVPVGEWRTVELSIRNVGFTSVDIRDVLAVEGNPSYRLTFEPGELAAQASRRITLHFHPLEEGPLAERLEVRSGVEEPIPPTAVKGVGVPTPIRLEPATLDFETLEVESERTLGVVVENPVDLPLQLTLEGPGAGRFRTDVLEIPPHGRLQLPAHYLPRTPGSDAATISVRSCPTCTPAQVQLQGRAVASAFAFDPAPVAFENTPLHTSTRSETKATNVTWRPVTVTGTRTSDHAFTQLAPMGGTEVAPGASVMLPVEFAARIAGPNVGNLHLDYRSDRDRASQVLLDASGGRPTLAFAPAALDFGSVPVGGKAQLVVSLSNAGTKGELNVLGVSAHGDAGQFGVRELLRGDELHPYAGAWPALEVAPTPIQPGDDALELRVFFEPTAEGTFNATVTVRTDDPFNPERTFTVTGSAYPVGDCQWALHPMDQLDFGNVPPGWGAVLGFYFENVGTEICAVKDIELNGDGDGAFFMPGGSLTGGVVPPGSGFSAMVAFRAPAPGTFHGELVLTANDPVTPQARLPIVGHAVHTCLTAAPNFLDFGPVRYDCSPEPLRTLISNQCATPITITGVAMGAGTSDQFSISEAPATPLTLAPGEGFEIEATYARTLLGQHFTPLFVSVDGETVPFLIPMLAETNHDDLADETFVQATPNLLDVLFVVGNTTTMGPLQEQLAQQVPGWLTAAQAEGLDLRVGVTTTGLVPRPEACPAPIQGGEAGRLVPLDGTRPRVTADGAVLQENVRVGACHHLVQGLETMRQALTPPLSNGVDDPRTPLPNDGNRGLVREEARLAVVVVSDEDDHSGFDPGSYIQLLQSLKGPGGSQRSRLHAIVPLTGSCRTATPNAERFAAVALGTGGELLDICMPNWRPLLDAIADEAVGLQSVFALGLAPSSEDDISVTVDGAESGDWTFNPADNAIVFNGGAVPAAGQRVRVRYRSQCGTVPNP